MARGYRAGERGEGEDHTRVLSVALIAAALLASAPAAPAQTKLSRAERNERVKSLPEKYKQFLLDVEPIMQESERETFLLLENDAQRELYITEFWRRRDRAEGTTNYAFRDRYYAHLDFVREEFEGISSDRGRTYLLYGEPTERLKYACGQRDVMFELWKYAFIRGLSHDVRFIFFRVRDTNRFLLWNPGTVSSNAIDSQLAVTVGTMQTCDITQELLKAMLWVETNKEWLMRDVFVAPAVNEEDAHKILRSLVLADPNAPKLPADFAIAFPQKQGEQTDARMTITVPRVQVALNDVSGSKLYSLDVTGEVLKDDQLFENYRYRFDYPGDTESEKLAIVLDRFLRPAEYEARIRVKDVNSRAEAIIEKRITVPAAADPPKGTPQTKLSRAERKERVKNLPEQYRQFLLDVEPIIQPEEENAFLTLDSDAQRDVFIDAFWTRHAPQGLSGDAYRTRYYELIEEAAQKYRRATDRYTVYVVNGEPADIYEPECRNYVVPIQVWHYASMANGGSTDVFFYLPVHGFDYRLWQPRGRTLKESLQELLTSPVGEEEGVDKVFFEHTERGLLVPPLVDRDCRQSERLRRIAEQQGMLPTPPVMVFKPAPVSEESMKLLLKSIVIADPKAPKFDAEMSVRFTQSNGNRTDAEMTIAVPRAKLAVTDVAGTKSYRLDVTGEVLKEERLFEKYRYRFDFPADTKLDLLPVVVDRMLPHGTYKVRMKVADAESHAETIIEREIEVPDAVPSVGAPAPGRAALPGAAAPTLLRIVPLPDQILSGVQHIETITAGPEIAAVEFYLDGRKIMTKRQPPYVLDLDLGDVPQPRRVRAMAVSAKGEPLAGDEVEVNSGSDPFRVRIVWPRVSVKLKGKTRVEMAVHVPDGKKLDRVQLFYNDTPVATLFEPPFVQTVDIPPSAGIGYLRATATLADDPAPPAEDTVIINTPQFMEEVNVHLVELPTTVLRNNRPVNDLDAAAFTVLDEGKPAKIAKFEHVTGLPLAVGLAIDTSGSMQPRMAEAQKAAAQFFRNTLKPGDRAFLLSFDVRTDVLQPWTSKIGDIAAGLSKLRAEESTALYDAVVYSLYNFVGVKGQKALVLITDGKDTASKFTFDQSLEYARRASVPIYAIGIGIGMADVDTRLKLGRLCTETGGNVYYIQQATDLDRVYADIQNELRSQYILGIYPPEGAKPGSKWHEVTVQVSDGKAKTIRGYYP
jgi:Ca-activated chloride channel family protein